MLPKKRSANGATATNGRTEKYRTFREQFEDPLNADALMNCRLKTAAHVAEMADLTQRNEGDTEEEAADDGDNVDSDPSTEEDEAQGGGGRRFRGLNFKKNGANQKNVFLAVCYLTGRIPELLQGDVVEFSTSKNGRCFKMLARELSESEPTLRGVTGPALQTMYMRIVKLSTELSLLLTTETKGRWTPTRLSNLAEKLVALNTTYNTVTKKEAQQKQGDRQCRAAEVVVMNEDVVSAVMITGTEYRARQRAKGKQRQQQQQQTWSANAEDNTEPLVPLNSVLPLPATESTMSRPTPSAARVQSTAVRPSTPRSTASASAPWQPASPVLVRHNSTTASNQSSTSASGFGIEPFQLSYHQLNNNYSELQRVVLTTVEKLKERMDMMENNIHGQGNNTRISLDSLLQRLLHGEEAIGHLNEVVGGLQKDMRATTSAVDTIQGAVKLLRTDISGISTSCTNRVDVIQSHLSDLRETLYSQKRRLDEVLDEMDEVKRARFSYHPPAPMGNNMPHCYDFSPSSSNNGNLGQFNHNRSNTGNTSNGNATPITRNNDSNDIFVAWQPTEAMYDYKQKKKKP